MKQGKKYMAAFLAVVIFFSISPKITFAAKKKKSSVIVKGKKAGKAKVQARIKKKKYTCGVTILECSPKKNETSTSKKITTITPNATATTSPAILLTNKPTVSPKTTASPKPTGSQTLFPTNTPSATPVVEPTASSTTEPIIKPTIEPIETPIPTPVNKIVTGNKVITIDESKTFPVALTELNETSLSSVSKSDYGEKFTDSTKFNEDGSVSFRSSENYKSGVSFYINPVTSADQIIDISETKGNGYYGYDDGTKDMSEYDYIRMTVTSSDELNFKAYNEDKYEVTYESDERNLIHDVTESIWKDDSYTDLARKVSEQYRTRTVFIPINELKKHGANPETLSVVEIGSQAQNCNVTIHSIDFVKVNYAVKVSGINVLAKDKQVTPGGTTTVSAEVMPANATRNVVKWSTSNEKIATVDSYGNVEVKKGAEGEVEIIASATDGSGIIASTTINVVVTTDKINLMDDDIVAKTNPGDGSDVAATKTDVGIEFASGKSLIYVSFEQYLRKKRLELAYYDEIKVTWEVQDAEGNKVTDYASAEGTPTYGKIAYVPASKLHGYDNGIDTNWTGEDDTEANTAWLASPFTGQTCTLTIAKTNPTELATVAGFNLQLQSLPENMHLVVTDITFAVNK